jgi:hypothetical protein
MSEWFALRPVVAHDPVRKQRAEEPEQTSDSEPGAAPDNETPADG